MNNQPDLLREVTNAASQKPTFKILSLDGGGFKGLSTAAALQVIEKHNKPLWEHFDLLCGTSTGGLIALALAAGKRADEIVDFYRNSGPKIFPPLSRWQTWGHTLRVLTSEQKHKYPDTALKKAVEDIVGGLQIRDSRCFLCIPSLNITTFQPRVFKTDHDKQLSRDSQLRMSQVALATAAAPTLFPITMCGESDNPEYFVDGGMWANNPSLVGLTEAMRFFVGPDKPYGNVALLSIGCAAGVTGRLASPAYSRWGNNFASEMIEAAGEAQQAAVLWQLKFLSESFQAPVNFTRIDIKPLSASQAQAVTLDSATPQAIEILLQLGTDAGHRWKSERQIEAFFAAPAAKIGLRPHS